MRFRLEKIITKTGDKGVTLLADRSVVSKSSEQIMAVGSVDETNSAIGLLRHYVTDEDIVDRLISIQHQLLIAGSEMAESNRSVIQERHIEFLENWADDLMAELEPVVDFVLPGGSQSAAHCHIARVTCRRAERYLIASMEQQGKSKPLLKQYINRLSDVLFLLARILNKQNHVTEIIVNRNI